MKRFLDLVVLGVFLVGGLGLIACDRNKVKFPKSLEFVLTSKANLTFEKQLLIKVKFLDSCIKTKPLKTWLSNSDVIGVVRVEGRDGDQNFSAVLHLQESCIMIAEARKDILTWWPIEMDRKDIEEHLKNLYQEHESCKILFNELTALSEDDIYRIIEDQVRSF